MDCPHCGNANIVSIDTFTERELEWVQAAILTMQEQHDDVVHPEMKAALTRALKKIRRWRDIGTEEKH